MTDRATACASLRRMVRLLALALVAAVVTATEVIPAAAQGAGTTVYLPVVPRNQPGLIADREWVSPFGVDIYGTINDAAELTRMRSAGASWVVTMFSWQEIEPTQGSQNWSSYDAQFLAVNNAGMDVAVLVTGVPAWARGTYPYAGGGPGMNVGALAAFLGRAAERYDGDGHADAPGSPVVKYWTLFAEPDYCAQERDEVCVPRQGEEFKGGWGRSGAAYAQMLQQVRAAIKAAAPNALVMNGGIAFDYFTDSVYPTPANPNRRGIYYRQFVADVIAAGGASPMDMLAVHYYPVTMSNWADKVSQLYDTAYTQAQADQMRSLPLISPEMGFWSAEGAGSSERHQAIRLVQMFTRGLSQGVQRMAWFAVFDGGPDTEEHGLFWGNDLSRPKAAFWAYKAMASQLHGFRYERAFYTEPRPLTEWDHEAYLFHRRADGARTLVAWANRGAQNPDGVSELVLDASQVTVVNALSLSAANPNVPQGVLVQDGAHGDLDGQANGQIQLRITEEPVYILLP